MNENELNEDLLQDKERIINLEGELEFLMNTARQIPYDNEEDRRDYLNKLYSMKRTLKSLRDQIDNTLK